MVRSATDAPVRASISTPVFPSVTAVQNTMISLAASSTSNETFAFVGDRGRQGIGDRGRFCVSAVAFTVNQMIITLPGGLKRTDGKVCSVLEKRTIRITGTRNGKEVLYYSQRVKESVRYICVEKFRMKK